LLVANGHRPSDIWSYSMKAIQIYVDLATHRLRQSLHDMTVAIRHSQGTDAKVFREFLNSLLQGDE
jgi:hypothetical protein